MKMLVQYRRVPDTEVSTGSVFLMHATLSQEVHFEDASLLKMFGIMSTLMRTQPQLPSEVLLQRADRAGLVPYKLDEETVRLIAEDPVAAATAMSVTSSPLGTVKTIQENRRPVVPPAIAAGFDVLADAFGEEVFFRVRKHELECPGCGFWSAYTTIGLLEDPERKGEVIKTAFVCRKKCKQRFIVTCHDRWGQVAVGDLLKTSLDGFYLPRAWNEHRPWVSREALELRLNDFRKEKEACSTATV